MTNYTFQHQQDFAVELERQRREERRESNRHHSERTSEHLDGQSPHGFGTEFAEESN